MRLQRGRVAGVTGAAHGIGRGVSELLAQRGCAPALVDCDAEGLQGFEAELRGSGTAVSAHVVNILSDCGLTGMPGKSGYCATKFAIPGFSEVLRRAPAR